MKVDESVSFSATVNYIILYSLILVVLITTLNTYCSVLGRRPLPGKFLCTEFQGVNIAASMRTYGIYILDKHPCGPKSHVVFKRPWAFTQDTTIIQSTCNKKNKAEYNHIYVHIIHACKLTFYTGAT